MLNDQKHFDTKQGVFRKEETKGYLNMNLKKDMFRILKFCEWAFELPQISIFL